MAAQGRRVLLLEKSHFPREKLCGEFISPECTAIFARLGVLDRILAAGSQRIKRMDLLAHDGRRIEVPLTWFTGDAAHGFGLTRARMDAILLDQARRVGVDVREGFQVSGPVVFHPEVREVNGRADGGGLEGFSAGLVIDASGRGRVFSPEATPEALKAHRARLFACKAHIRGFEGPGEVGELYFFHDGYGGICEVESDGAGRRSCLCFLTTEETLRKAKGDRERLLELTVLSNPVARRRLRGAVVTDAWLGTGPISYGRKQNVPGVIAIGDAGAFIDPFTGSGILLALTTGELVADVINRAFDAGVCSPDLIARNYEKRHRATFNWRFRAASVLRRLAFKPAARKLLVPVIARHQTLVRLLALSTRRSSVNSG
jgi:flavin-dependent dehydrogenase